MHNIMITSPILRPTQSKATINGLDVDQILLKTECLPILVGVHKFRHLTAVMPSTDTSNIANFVLKNRRCPDIELYWSQASKFLSGAKPASVQANRNLHCAKAADHFWMVLHEITQRCPVQPDDPTNIFSDRAFIKILNSVLPILISCFPITELSLLLRPLLTSSLSSEHISNIAVNLPFICGQISEVLQTYLRDAQEPSMIWRSSRILLKVASRDKQLAVSVRNSLVKRNEHPLLCLNITREFIHDTEEFIDRELCARLVSSVSSSWLLSVFRDSDLLIVSQSAIDRLKILLSSQRQHLAEDQLSFFGEIKRCARIISICSSVHGCDVINKQSACSSCGQVEIVRYAIAALLGAFEGTLGGGTLRGGTIREGTLGDRDRCTSDTASEEYAEMALRVAIVLIIVNFLALAATDTKSRREGALQSQWVEGALYREETALSALLVSALKMQRWLIDRPSTSSSGTARESAKRFNLCYRLAVTFGSDTAVRSLCVRELALEHCSEFLVESDMAKAIGILARVTQSHERLDRKDKDKAFCDEFLALQQPSIISGSSEASSDWMSCLSLMLSCDLLQGLREKDIEDGVGVLDRVVGQSCEESSEDCTVCSAHTLMISVLGRAHWPPHSLLQTCIDRWLMRCVGVRVRIGSSADRIGGPNREYPRLGLPLLRNEAHELTRGLQISRQSADSLCDTCSRIQLRTGVGGGGGVALIGEECKKYLKRWGFWTRFDIQVSATEGENDTSDFKGHDPEPDCRCEHSDEDDMDWSGVTACYTALQYASLSMSLSSDPSAGSDTHCEAMYLNPFVCDIRSLPIKRAIQYMLLKHTPNQASPAHATLADTDRTTAAAALMMSKIIELANVLCPELLVADRGGCFEYQDMTSRASPPAALSCILIQEDEVESLLQIWLSLIAPNGTGSGTDLLVAQYTTACELVRSPQFILSLSSDSSSASKTIRFLQELLYFAFRAGADRQRSAGLWTVWRALHDAYPCPQQLELLSLNFLLSSIPSQRPRILTSYEQLVQDPLQLFNLPTDTLSDLFSLRLVVFITRSALEASKCAARLALAIRHKVAENFITAAVRRRSTTEVSLYLHEDTFLDLQDLMAVRLLLGLWDTWSDVSDGSDGEKRIILNNFLSSLMDGNPRLCSLMLSYQLPPRSFELLLSCDSSIVSKISTTHLQFILDTTLAVRTLPEPSAIVIDPKITSSSLTFAANFSAASALATSNELPPEDLERLLMHSLCILRLTRRSQTARDQVNINTNMNMNMKAKDFISANSSIILLAEALPSFLISATNCLNAHLSSSDVKEIEQLSLSIVHELFGHFSAYAEPLRDFAHKPEAVATANTAAIMLVIKLSNNKGHNKAAEEDVVIKARPAIVALRKIVKKVEQLHPKPQILPDPPTQGLAVDSTHFQSTQFHDIQGNSAFSPALGKTSRVEALEPGEEPSSRKKGKFGSMH